MRTKILCKQLVSLPILPCLANKGQALVEFTLVFILLLVVAWIPADFGLAMYTGQIAQNASREGARVAAADPTLAAGQVQCVMPCAGATGILKVTSDRLSSAMLPGATITVNRANVLTSCENLVTVSINGTYHYFFYQILKMFGVGGNLNTVNVQRQTSMRWEHQC